MENTTERGTLIERIAKLFALADESRNPSEAEVLAALTAAKKLMMAHDITEAEVRKASGATGPAWKFQAGQPATEPGRINLMSWELALSVGVERLTGTQTFYQTVNAFWTTGKHQYHRTICFAGDELDCAIACAMFGTLSKHAQRLAREENKGDRRKQSSYLDGFAAAVVVRGGEHIKQPKAEANAYAIVSTEKKTWLATEMAKAHPKMRPSKQKDREIDGDAFRAGFAAGQRADIGTANKVAGAAA